MNRGKILALIGIGLYALQVWSSRTDANGNSLTPDTLVLISGTASFIYVVIAGVVLWKIGHKRIAWALPVTFIASGAAVFLTPNPSALNLALNAIRVVAFGAYIYAVYLLFVSDGKRLAPS
ncbi:MAG: hypothetical protein ACREHE_15595 [Rhizomicrobium sp.]